MGRQASHGVAKMFCLYCVEHEHHGTNNSCPIGGQVEITFRHVPSGDRTLSRLPRVVNELHQLKTERLILRRFDDGDLHPFMAYRNDPVVARFQSWEGITENEAQAFIAGQKAQQVGEPGQGAQIAIERRDTGQLIGDCFLKVDSAEPRQAELGFTLSRDHQGHGFAAEAVSCLLSWAFVKLKLHRIIAITDCDNAAAIALLERLHFRREGKFLQSYWNKGRWTDEYLYTMLEGEWRA